MDRERESGRAKAGAPVLLEKSDEVPLAAATADRRLKQTPRLLSPSTSHTHVRSSFRLLTTNTAGGSAAVPLLRLPCFLKRTKDTHLPRERTRERERDSSPPGFEPFETTTMKLVAALLVVAVAMQVR